VNFHMKIPSALNYDLAYSEMFFSKWTADEFKSAWHREPLEQGQGEAKGREKYCVVVPVLKESDALILACLFTRTIGFSPSCTHWDGSTLSLHYGQGGHYTLHSQREAVTRLVDAWKWGLVPDTKGALFAGDLEPTRMKDD